MSMQTMGPNMALTAVELGEQQINQHIDWTAAYHLYPNVRIAINFSERSKRTVDETHSHYPVPDVNLWAEQQEGLEFFKSQAGGSNTERLCIIQGKAGSGKSFMISFSTSYLCSPPDHGLKSFKLLHHLVWPVNISGATLRSTLHIPVSRGFCELEAEELLSFQSDFEDLRFMNIDEFSLIGGAFLGKVDKRCRQAKPDAGHLCFGGLYVTHSITSISSSSAGPTSLWHRIQG